MCGAFVYDMQHAYTRAIRPHMCTPTLMHMQYTKHTFVYVWDSVDTTLTRVLEHADTYAIYKKCICVCVGVL